MRKGLTSLNCYGRGHLEINALTVSVCLAYATAWHRLAARSRPNSVFWDDSSTNERLEGVLFSSCLKPLTLATSCYMQLLFTWGGCMHGCQMNERLRVKREEKGWWCFIPPTLAALQRLKLIIQPSLLGSYMRKIACSVGRLDLGERVRQRDKSCSIQLPHTTNH